MRHGDRAKETALVVIEWLGMLVVLCGAIGPLLLLAISSIGHSWFWPALLPGEWSGRAWSSVLAPVAGVVEALVTSLLIAV
ncbi:MAG: hypothetical protein ACK496_05960, partial [Acidobacteriota bacterium]